MNVRTKDRIITALMTIVFIAVYCLCEHVLEQQHVEQQTQEETP